MAFVAASNSQHPVDSHDSPAIAIPQPIRESLQTRLFAGLVFLASIALLLVAAWLTPAPDGHGTHTQLGLPRCAWEANFGKPCMTCGMTTAFAWAAHGHFVRSVLAQPFGALLAVTTAIVSWASLFIAVTGSTLGRALRQLSTPRFYWVLGILFLGAWVYKLITWNG